MIFVNKNLIKLVALTSFLSLSSCSTERVRRLQDDLFLLSQTDPSLSGDGNKLAVIVDQQGRQTVQLRDIRKGQVLQLRHFSRNQPHSSPSLSWTGRYLAVLTQFGDTRIAIIEDRLTGRLHRLRIPGKRVPVRLSLAPDASKLAFQFAEQGQWRVELFDLTQKLDLDEMVGIGSINSSLDK